MGLLRRWFGGEGPRLYERGMRHYNVGEHERALECFEGALDDLPGGSHPYHALSRFYIAEIHGRLGARLLAEGEDEAALQHLLAALQEQPDYPDLHFRVGVARLRQGDLSGAEASAREALRRNAEYAEAWVLRALVAREQGSAAPEEEALARARRAVAERPGPVARLLAGGGSLEPAQLYGWLFESEQRRQRIEKAELLFHQGFWKESKELLVELVGEHPGFADLRLKLAVVQFQLQENADALRQVDAALARNPGFADAQALAGALRLRVGEFAAARDHYHEASGGERQAQGAFVAYGLAVSQLLLGELEACQEALRPVLREPNPGPNLRALAGALLYLQGEPRAAFGTWDDLLEAGAEVDVVLDAMAAALESGDEERAERFSRRLPAGAPNPSVAIARALLLSRRGRAEAALDVLDAALGQHPRQPGLLLESARQLAQAGDAGAALRRVESLVALQPALPGPRALRGRLLLAAQRPAEALEELREERALAGAGYDVELDLLFALRRAQRAREAQEQWQQLQWRFPLRLRTRLQEPARWLAPLAGLAP